MERATFQKLLDRLTPERITEANKIYKELLQEVKKCKDTTPAAAAVLLTGLLIEYGRLQAESDIDSPAGTPYK